MQQNARSELGKKTLCTKWVAAEEGPMNERVESRLSKINPLSSTSLYEVTMLPATVAGEYPPPPLVGKPFAQTAIPYSVLFVVGTLGNTAVLAYVFFITRSLKSSVTALGNTFIYVVALCAVDLLVTVSIPFSLSNTILNNWVFGEFGCKLHWAVELSNKMCSTFILTALAFDRYMAICHPENKRVSA
ncbi:hypothetical protein COOONC_22365 [Cooperia oncophora]